MEPSSCRDASGRLVLGDIILALNNKPVKLQKDLFAILDDCKVRCRCRLPSLSLSHKFTVEKGLPMGSAVCVRDIITISFRTAAFS